MRNFWAGIKQTFQEGAADINSDVKSSGKGAKIGGVIVLVIVVFLIVIGMIWSSSPSPFDVNVATQNEVGRYQHKVVTGSTTTATLVTVTSTLLDKSGGFISNDIMPPGVWLDNMPNWEYGVLIQVRDLSKAMREAFSRSQSQSTEDSDLAIAESRFNFDNNSWALPPSESEYKEGIKYMRGYLERLGDEDRTNAQFYSRADNLRYWLGTVESRLGSLSQRLRASVGQRRLNTDLAGSPDASRSTNVPDEEFIKTPWAEIDDVFYEARGTAWALSHFLRAAEVDFADVLEKKNARVSLQQIIRELDGTQETVMSPMILNGDGFGFLANHSLVMANYISRAHAAIIDLRELLAQG